VSTGLTAIYGLWVSSLLALLICVSAGVARQYFHHRKSESNRWRDTHRDGGIVGSIPSVVLGLWPFFVMEPILRLSHFPMTPLAWFPLFQHHTKGSGNGHPAILIPVVMICRSYTAISRERPQTKSHGPTARAYAWHHPLDCIFICDSARRDFTHHWRGHAGPRRAMGITNGRDHDPRQTPRISAGHCWHRATRSHPHFAGNPICESSAFRWSSLL